MQIKSNKTIFCLFLFFIIGILYSSPDCLDNSHHMEEKYDSGGYYSVAKSKHGPCYCPCEKQYKLSPDRGKCWNCGHYRVPRPLVLNPAPAQVLDAKIINVKKLKARAKKQGYVVSQR